MAEVDILMAAYNGEKYIVEQIESILAQTFQNFRLVIRDDGSDDSTPAIIEEYAAKFPDKIEVVHDNEICRNATHNFFELLKHAKADYVMFSDQDDVWLPEKVQLTFEAMKKAELENPNITIMVFAGLRVVNVDLSNTYRLMTVDVPAARCDFRCIIYCNIAAGCTQMLNRLLYEDMGEYSEEISYHDWWATLYASAFGKIVHIPQVVMLYRLHNRNVVGTNTQKLLGWRGAPR